MKKVWQTDGRTDRQTDWTIHRAASSQLNRNSHHLDCPTVTKRWCGEGYRFSAYALKRAKLTVFGYLTPLSTIFCLWMCKYMQNVSQNTVNRVMMSTLSSLAAPEVVIMTTSGAASDDKVGIMTTLCFQRQVLIKAFIWHLSYIA